jgi:hypothetical protein
MKYCSKKGKIHLNTQINIFKIVIIIHNMVKLKLLIFLIIIVYRIFQIHNWFNSNNNIFNKIFNLILNKYNINNRILNKLIQEAIYKVESLLNTKILVDNNKTWWIINLFLMDFYLLQWSILILNIQLKYNNLMKGRKNLIL